MIFHSSLLREERLKTNGLRNDDQGRHTTTRRERIPLDYSLEKAAAFGYPVLCFEGNIDFYGKSGFTCASAFGIRYHGLPEGADASFFLCKELVPGYLNGVSGEYAPPDGYFVAEREPEAFERFDAQFPPKEKLKLPGQIF